jgi:hypothetical protein
MQAFLVKSTLGLAISVFRQPQQVCAILNICRCLMGKLLEMRRGTWMRVRNIKRL